MGYPPKLAEIVDTLSLVPDRLERIDMLISIADRFVEVPETIARRPFAESHKVPACESEAYVWARRQDDDTLKFYFAIENPQGISAKAMAVILDDSLSGQPLDDVGGVSSEVIYEIFGKELSMGKSMGLMSMVTMVTASAKKRLSEDAGRGHAKR